MKSHSVDMSLQIPIYFYYLFSYYYTGDFVVGVHRTAKVNSLNNVVKLVFTILIALAVSLK